MLRKQSECIKNRFYAKNYTSRPHIPKIAVKFSKMVSPDQIWYRGSLMTPIVAEGLKTYTKKTKTSKFYGEITTSFSFQFSLT